MSTATTRLQSTASSQSALYVALELSRTLWKLGLTVGFGQKPRERNVRAGDLAALYNEIQLAKKRFGLDPSANIYCCYEAGRDGFWIHRALEEIGLHSFVVDPASIEMPRRHRRAKTDRLDVHKLLRLLIRYCLGETRALSVVRVPSVEDEDNRHLHRELATLKQERTAHINRIKSFLFGVGVQLKPRWRIFTAQLDQIRLWDGSALPPALHDRILREYGRLQLLQRQIVQLQAERNRLLRERRSPAIDKVRTLNRLFGVGVHGAWVLAMEFFSWRQLSNRRQVGALPGLAPTPHDSGDSAREQGISKAGSRLVRALAIEMAWAWLRYQPRSQLSQWFQERFAAGGARLRKIGIVALARKLLIALWRWCDHGVLPAGAELRAAR